MNRTAEVSNASFKATLDRGAGKFKVVSWYIINTIFFKNSLSVSSKIKVGLLKLFGASIGKGVVIKPGVNIKFPWRLEIGDHSWIGENVWIDNLAMVSIRNNVTVSQGAFLLTGNHNYKHSAFTLLTQPIILEDGVWICAGSIVCPGVTCGSHAVLTVGSVANKDLLPYKIYQGNPAIAVKNRVVT